MANLLEFDISVAEIQAAEEDEDDSVPFKHRHEACAFHQHIHFATSAFSAPLF